MSINFCSAGTSTSAVASNDPAANVTLCSTSATPFTAPSRPSYKCDNCGNVMRLTGDDPTAKPTESCSSARDSPSSQSRSSSDDTSSAREPSSDRPTKWDAASSSRGTSSFSCQLRNMNDTFDTSLELYGDGPTKNAPVSSSAMPTLLPPSSIKSSGTSTGLTQGGSHAKLCEFDWGPGEDEQLLPDLIIVRQSNSVPASDLDAISGRRIVSPAHFIQAIRDLEKIDCCGKGGRFVYKSEKRVGLWSEFKFFCDKCDQVKTITTDPVSEPTPLKDKTKLGVNDCAVWGFASIGSGHANLVETLSILGIPTMSKGAYSRREESLGQVNIKFFTLKLFFHRIWWLSELRKHDSGIGEELHSISTFYFFNYS